MKKLIGELELNRIYQRDCIEGMRMLPDKSVDLIVIDPPYNIGKDTRWDKWKTVDAYIKFMAEVFTECERVLKPNGSFYFWHNDMVQIRKLMDATDANTSFIFNQFITWDKYNGSKWNQLNAIVHSETNRNYPKQAEYCLYYVKPSGNIYGETGWERVKLDVNNFEGLRKYFHDLHKATGLTKKAIMEVVGQRADHCLRYNSSQWGLPTEATYLDIINLVTDETFNTRNFSELYTEFESLRIQYERLVKQYEEERYTFNNSALPSVWIHEPIAQNGHITPKPTPLIENIIRTSSNEGDVVLDCFMGSGTTAVAAARLNRYFIGFERESEYIEIANKRLDNEITNEGETK